LAHKKGGPIRRRKGKERHDRVEKQGVDGNGPQVDACNETGMWGRKGPGSERGRGDIGITGT